MEFFPSPEPSEYDCSCHQDQEYSTQTHEEFFSSVGTLFDGNDHRDGIMDTKGVRVPSVTPSVAKFRVPIVNGHGVGPCDNECRVVHEYGVTHEA